MEDYIKPITPDNVAGFNIAYNDDFQKLQILVQDKPEQQFGDFIAEAEGTNWDEIYRIASELLLNQSKDLLVMSYFTQSGIVRYGLSGLADGLKIIYENLDQYWEELYPHLEDEDGDFDPDFRINALSLFSSHDGILKEIKNAFLLKDSVSNTSFKVKAVESVIDARNDGIDYSGGLEKLGIDLQIAAESETKELTAIIDSLHYLEQIDKLFEDKIQLSLGFDDIKKLFSKILKVMPTTYESTENIDAHDISPNDQHPSTKIAATQTMNWANYQIESRKDINLLLEKIHIYFEKNEPSHPAPLFIRRMQRLLNLNFYEIMQDISPESIGRLEALVGEPLKNNDQNEDD